MVKHSRKTLKRPKRKSYRKKSSKVGRWHGKMVGGAYTPEEKKQLLDLGFTDNDIDKLATKDVTFNLITYALSEINPATNVNLTPRELMEGFDEAVEEINSLDISGISESSDDEHELNDSMDDGSLHLSDLDVSDASQGSSITPQGSPNSSITSQGSTDNSFTSQNFQDCSNSIASQGSLHLSDLDVSQGSSSTDTTREDSFGGRKRKSYGKTRKIKKVRKHVRKSRKQHRKQRGGMCFGNGVGANNYDPNFSIYNTRELTLFPYRPTN